MKTGLVSVLFVATVAGATLFLTLTGYEIPANRFNEAMAGNEPTVAEILDRYIEAVGGREALERITTRVCIGRTVTDLRSWEHPIYEESHFEAYSKTPSSYFTETWSDAGNFIRAYDGKTGWIKDKCGVRVDDDANTDWLDWLLNPQFALNVAGYFPDLVLTGMRQVREYEVYVMESPACRRPLFFDTESGFLIGCGYNWEIHDYREVNGIMYPHRVHISRKGGSTVYEFDTVEHNIEIADSLFRMPDNPR